MVPNRPIPQLRSAGTDGEWLSRAAVRPFGVTVLLLLDFPGATPRSRCPPALGLVWPTRYPGLRSGLSHLRRSEGSGDSRSSVLHNSAGVELNDFAI